MNTFLEIEYTVEDSSLTYRLVYIIGRKLRGRRNDKTWPKTTQCLLFKNGLLISWGEVVKCDDDRDNLSYALKLVTKKVMPDVWFKDIRKQLWGEIESQIKELGL